jgi:hypothetical protein
VLEGAVAGAELAELQADVERILAYATALLPHSPLKNDDASRHGNNRPRASPAIEFPDAPPWFAGMRVGGMPPFGQDAREQGRNPAAMETHKVKFTGLTQTLGQL